MLQLSERQRLAARETAVLRETALKLLALEADRRKAFNLASVGQKVFLAADVAKKYNISQGPYTVAKTKGDGDDQFADLAELRDVSGGPWPMRSKDFLPAPTAHGRSPLEGTPTINIREDQMAINTAADKFEAAVNARIARGERPDDALRAQSQQSARDNDGGADAYRLSKLGSVQVEAPSKPAASFNLSADVSAKAEGGGVPFHELVSQHARETGKDYRTATRELAIMYPELADAR